jgi:hypothetical protein
LVEQGTFKGPLACPPPSVLVRFRPTPLIPTRPFFRLCPPQSAVSACDCHQKCHQFPRSMPLLRRLRRLAPTSPPTDLSTGAL